ncbi:MAG: ABC transporter permease [Clostridiales bacterium]|nr:ABC transporter permease [Clostridiales bacterium]
MKTFSLVSYFKDIFAQIKLSLKLLVRDRITMFVFFFSCFCFFFICSTLNFSAEDQSKLPIGLANLDCVEEEGISLATDGSKQLVDRILSSNSFRVMQGSVDNLKVSLRNGEINCIFVINKGYEQSLKRGYTKGIITLYKSSGNKTASMLADVFAGEMIDQICVEKSYLAYKKLDFTDMKELNEEEYKQYVEKMKADDEFEFVFDVKLYDPETTNSSYEKLGNAVLYREIVAGIFAMLLSFVILFSFTYVCMEKEQGILLRKRLTLLSRLSCEIGNLVSVLTTTFLLCLIFVFCICYYAKVFNGFGALLWLSIRYTIVVSLIFMVLARIAKSVVSYQLIGAIVILILGMLGFCTLVDGIAFKNLLNLLENTPNGWFIQKFVDIILIANR